MAAEKKRSVQLGPGRMKLAGYERQEWVVNAPAEHTETDITNPEYFAIVAAQMRPYDRVEIRAEDGTWIIEGIVIGCDRNWAKVHILAKHKLTGVDEAMGDLKSPYRVEFKGPQKKWCIIRNSDNAFIRESIGTKDDAYTELDALKKVAA